MRWGTTIVDQHRSYPHDQQAVRVDDTDTSQLQAAARELQALVLHEQARHLAEVRAMLAERYRRDGVQIADAELEAQADYLALLERGDRFLKDVATRLHPGSELLELARQLDDHALGCGGRPPAAWWTTARRAWRTCAGGWRRSSAPSCAATPTWSEPKPSSAVCGAASVWSGGDGGIVSGRWSWRASWPTAAGGGSGRSSGLPTWTRSCG
jgi:hypothetical protein